MQTVETVWFESFWQEVNKKCFVSENCTFDIHLNCCEIRNVDDDDERYGKTSPSLLFLSSSPPVLLLL
jgi:hypothetical protein